MQILSYYIFRLSYINVYMSNSIVVKQAGKTRILNTAILILLISIGKTYLYTVLVGEILNLSLNNFNQWFILIILE